MHDGWSMMYVSPDIEYTVQYLKCRTSYFKKMFLLSAKNTHEHIVC